MTATEVAFRSREWPRWLTLLVLSCVTVALNSGPARAAAGDLDTSFSGDGKRIIKVTGDASFGWAVAIQSDGKILLAGQAPGNDGQPSFVVIRLNSDGSFDSTFGNGGYRKTPFTSRPDTAYGIALQSDGKRELDFEGGVDYANAVAIQDDGNIVVGGFESPSGSSDQSNFALARLKPSGKLDTTFGDGGRVTTDVSPGLADGVIDLALQSNGKIVAAGSEGAPDAPVDSALARYRTDGSLDPGFGPGGTTTTSFSPGDDSGLATAIQDNGRIVVAGFTSTGVLTWGIAAARYLAS